MMTSNDSGSLQASSLSTLIGYITGPKAEQPVGVRVVEPPSGTRQKQRGNLYAVVDLYGNRADRDVIADHLLTVIQRTYYSAKGSQSHVMIESVRRAHHVLHEINMRHPDSALRAGVLCAALLNGRLVVVASGPAMALIRVNDQVQMFPSELRMDTDADPDGDVPMQIFRQNLGRDDVMFLGGSSWLSLMPIKTLGGIVAFANADNCADAADELYAYGGGDSPPGLLIVLVEDPDAPQPAPTTPTSGPAREQQSGPSRFLGLPTALGAKPPTRTASPPAADIQQAPALSAEPQSPEPPSGIPIDTRPVSSTDVESATAPEASAGGASSPVHAVASAAEELHPERAVNAAVASDGLEDSVGETHPGAEEHQATSSSGTTIDEVSEVSGTTEKIASADYPDQEASATLSEHASRWSAKMSVAATAGIAQTKRFLTRMLPDSSRAEPAADESSDDDGDESDEPHPASDLFVASAEAPAAFPPLSDETLPPDEDAFSERQRTPLPPLPEIEPYAAPAPSTGTRARLFVLIALLILILVPAVVGGIYWSEGETRRKQAEDLTLTAGAKVTSAEAAMLQGEQTPALEDLADARDYLTEAIALDGSNPERTEIAFKIEQLLLDVMQVQPLYALTTPLLTFPADSRPNRVLVADSSIYVLDSGQQAILRFPYDPSTDAVTDESPQVVLQQGAVIEGATVGTLSDMAWLPQIAGIQDKATLLVLDRNNNLFSYDPRVEGARRLSLKGQADWRSASQVQTYNGRTYLADEGTNEIYRYSPGADTDPDLWFSEDTLVNLAGTLSMEIDGDIWLLLSSGNILRYRSGPAGGEQLPFSLENSVGLAEEPVDMYVTREDLDQIYLADAGDDRILVYGKDGGYQMQLRAAEGDPLQGLSGIYIDEIAERLFILTSSSLYSHPLL